MITAPYAFILAKCCGACSGQPQKRPLGSSQNLPFARRFATVEPVFGNLRGNKRLHRFTLRGKAKVCGQWKLYCLVHDVEKLANHGYAR